MIRLRARIANLLKNEPGVTAIEYALIAALIAVAAIAAFTLVGTNLSNTSAPSQVSCRGPARSQPHPLAPMPHTGQSFHEGTPRAPGSWFRPKDAVAVGF